MNNTNLVAIKTNSADSYQDIITEYGMEPIAMIRNIYGEYVYVIRPFSFSEDYVQIINEDDTQILQIKVADVRFLDEYGEEIENFDNEPDIENFDNEPDTEQDMNIIDAPIPTPIEESKDG